MNLIQLAEQDLEAGWQWVKTEAVDIYHVVLPLIQAPLKLFESGVVQDLWSAAAALVTKVLAVGTPLNLGDLETAFLNTVESLGGQLLAAAQALGSALLQTFLGLIQAKQTA